MTLHNNTEHMVNGSLAVITAALKLAFIGLITAVATTSAIVGWAISPDPNGVVWLLIALMLAVMLGCFVLVEQRVRRLHW